MNLYPVKCPPSCCQHTHTTRPLFSKCAGAYFHPKFIREDRSLCKDIVRVKTETVNSKRDNTKIRKRKQSSASSHGSQQRQRQQTQEQYDTALPPPIHLQQNPPMAITSSLSSSISPPSNHTQGYSFHQSVPPNKFSQNLLIHSEDIISLFGDGF